MYLLFTDFILLLLNLMNLVSLLKYTHTVPLDGQAYQFHQVKQIKISSFAILPGASLTNRVLPKHPRALSLFKIERSMNLIQYKTRGLSLGEFY